MQPSVSYSVSFPAPPRFWFLASMPSSIFKNLKETLTTIFYLHESSSLIFLSSIFLNKFFSFFTLFFNPLHHSGIIDLLGVKRSKQTKKNKQANPYSSTKSICPILLSNHLWQINHLRTLFVKELSFSNKYNFAFQDDRIQMHASLLISSCIISYA